MFWKKIHIESLNSAKLCFFSVGLECKKPSRWHGMQISIKTLTLFFCVNKNNVMIYIEKNVLKKCLQNKENVWNEAKPRKRVNTKTSLIIRLRSRIVWTTEKKVYAQIDCYLFGSKTGNDSYSKCLCCASMCANDCSALSCSLCFQFYKKKKKKRFVTLSVSLMLKHKKWIRAMQNVKIFRESRQAQCNNLNAR